MNRDDVERLAERLEAYCPQPDPGAWVWALELAERILRARAVAS